MSPDQVVERCRDLTTPPLGAVAEQWKADHPGGRAVAAYPVWAPVELIHAAGMLPLSLLGGGTSVELTHADARFQSFVCSIAKSTLELGFQGLVNGVDGLVFSNICDVARNLSSIYKRNFPGMFVEYLHLPQNSTSPAVVEYAAAELRRLGDSFGDAFGLPVTPTALAKSIVIYNGLRARLRALYALRIAEPHKLSTTELYVILRAASLATPEESITWLDVLLERSRAARPGLGIGCASSSRAPSASSRRSGCWTCSRRRAVTWSRTTCCWAGAGSPPTWRATAIRSSAWARPT